jgi:hypothetical protein
MTHNYNQLDKGKCDLWNHFPWSIQNQGHNGPTAGHIQKILIQNSETGWHGMDLSQTQSLHPKKSFLKKFIFSMNKATGPISVVNFIFHTNLAF